MMPLFVEDFSDWFFALWGRAPYPWQRRLLGLVAETGRWPAHLDLPTGAGKTSALDIALFWMALEAHQPPAEQRAPRRVFLVVDRRTIVDQAFARADALLKKHKAPTDPKVQQVADRLRSLAREADDPFQIALLRGAMVRDDSWARRPDQPLLGLSTVDQVGSRLLFRGYGVSDGMKPVHAGLLGRDCLYLLDEVHLSKPFEQTLSRLAGAPVAGDTGRPNQVARLSATYVGRGEEPFALQEEDRATPALARRLEANKPLRCELIEVKGEEAAAAFARRIAALAVEQAGPGRTVGVIVNRVETARLVAAALPEGAALITGRMRPIDRQAVEAQIGPWVDPERASSTEGPARFVVATQCVEAGADYDLDGLVTECAPIDALRQRAGRLNRSGLRVGARCVVVMRKDQLKVEDPVYGMAMAETWGWLAEQKVTDLGIHAFAAHALFLRPELFVKAPEAPLLLPHHLRALAQTSPVPAPDPDISLFLHGPQRPSLDVSVVWRADLSEDELASATVEELVSRLELSPPGSLEAMPLPIGALRRWLDPKDKRAISLSDAGNPLEEESQDWRMEAPPTVFVWRGEESERRSLRDLKPGDTVVLAATRGGLRRGNFDPASREPVTDLGDAVQWAQRQRPTLRCHPALLAQYGLPAAPESPSEETEELFEEALRAFLSADPPAQPKWLAPVWKSLKAKRRVVTGPPGAPITLLGRARRGEESSGEDTSAHTGVAVPLARHLRGVGDWAADFAAAVGLSAARVDDLREAGRQHDIGKADPRFQRWLHGGSEVRAALSPHPLAKSAIPASDRAAREAARRRSGYPKGARHELQSLALLQGDAAWLEELAARGGDAELVLFLVASHHGHCRPFAPVVLDPLPVTVQFEGRAASSDHGLARLDSGVSSRFWRLVERYGPHGLAALEALLRLADHHRSALEQKEGLYD